MATNKLRQQEDEILLQEYLKMKPSRAVDRLLSEYSIEKGLHLYNMLQEKIKRNTTELRVSLTDKYENLVDCSNLLNTIKAFTDQIEAIEKNITRVFSQDPLMDQDDSAKLRRSMIAIIEEKLFQKKYSLAMSMTFQRYQQIEESQLLYLPILRIQILSCLEEEIIDKKFTKVFIKEIIQCLRLYIRNLNPSEQRQIIRNERPNGQILTLISQALQAKGSTENIVQKDLIEIIFRCKLLSLHRRQGRAKEQQKISKFFYDIYQLIDGKERDGDQLSHLCGIFCKNYYQIESHLLQTFIVKEEGTISFRYELYQKLATSQAFIEVLENIYQVISRSYAHPPALTLKESFLSLWQSYYHELLNLLFQKVNPVNFLPSIAIDQLEYPRQISKYFCSDDLSIQSRIKRYESQVNSFYAYVNKLLKESEQLKSSKFNSRQIIQQIINLYANKVSQLNIEIHEFMASLSVSPNLKKLGSLIYLFIYSHQFNAKMQLLCRQKQYLNIRPLQNYQLQSNYQIVKPYFQCFYDQTGKQTQWSISFDHFFMKYYNPSLKSQTPILQNVILLLLEATMQSIDRGRTEAFLQERQARKLRQREELQEKQNKLGSISANDLKPSTFAKKKIVQIEEDLKS